MNGEISITTRQDSDVATRGDVKEIVADIVAMIVDDRLDKFEKKVDRKFVAFEARMDERFALSEMRTDEKFESFAGKVLRSFQHVEGRIDDLEEKIDVVVAVAIEEDGSSELWAEIVRRWPKS